MGSEKSINLLNTGLLVTRKGNCIYCGNTQVYQFNPMVQSFDRSVLLKLFDGRHEFLFAIEPISCNNPNCGLLFVAQYTFSNSILLVPKNWL